MSIGKIISISDLMVEAFLTEGNVKRRDMLYAEDGGRRYEFEVQDIHGNVAGLVPNGRMDGFDSRHFFFVKVTEGKVQKAVRQYVCPFLWTQICGDIRINIAAFCDAGDAVFLT